MTLPKPEPRARQQARERRQQAAARRACREAVILRDQGRCRVCEQWVGHSGHVHERTYRSRGGSPVDPENCVLLCAGCHLAAHAHRLGVLDT